MLKARSWSSLIGLFAAVALGVVACGPTPTANQSPIRTPAASVSNEPQVTIPADAQQIVDLIRQDLAQRLNTAQGTITIVDVKAVEWPDASLGCPEPGTMYAQVITPGYQIELRAGGREYTYHTGGDRFVLCENGKPAADEGRHPRALVPTPPAAENDGETRLSDLAKADLAQRLEIPADQIQVVTNRAVEWPDSSLGCPEPGMMYAQVITPGYQIVLAAQGREYQYHASLTDVFLCTH